MWQSLFLHIYKKNNLESNTIALLNFFQNFTLHSFYCSLRAVTGWLTTNLYPMYCNVMANSFRMLSLSYAWLDFLIHGAPLTRLCREGSPPTTFTKNKLLWVYKHVCTRKKKKNKVFSYLWLQCPFSRFPFLRFSLHIYFLFLICFPIMPIVMLAKYDYI